MGFKIVFETSFAAKGFRLATGGIDAARLMSEQMSMLSDDWINFLPEVRKKFINRSKSIHPKDSSANFKLLVDITTTSEKTVEKPIECRRSYDSIHSRQKRNGADVFFDGIFPGHQLFSMKKHPILVENHFKLLNEIATLPGKTGEEIKENRNNEETEDTLGDKEENEGVEEEEVADNFQENDENPATSKQLDTFNTKDVMPVQDSSAYFKLRDDITTTPNDIGEEPSTVKNAAADKRCNHKLRIIKLYNNVIGNETERMMNSIDMVVSEAEHLFGVERTQIFFDLLNYNLFHFGSAGVITTFVPNMAESDVRQHIMSFFEHACDTMNRLMRLLLSCTDSTNLQQMPEQDFTSLMKSVIDSSLQTNFKGGERISSEVSTSIMVDSEEFQRALGVKIPDDVLDRVGRGEEMVAHMFLDTKLVRNESRPIRSLFFPSDCRLFISIPIESESY